MAGLNDLDADYPKGAETPTLGDNRIRAIIAKLKEWAAIEHSLAGPHTILSGDIASRPAFGNAGRLYVLAVPGISKEIQRDTGTAWETITSNEDLLEVVVGLAAHIAATTLDHPTGSVTAAKIGLGAVLANHLNSSLAATSIAALVSAGSADALHTHPQYIPVEGSGLIVPDDLTDLTDGWVTYGSAPTERTILHNYDEEYKRIKTKRAGNFKVYFTLAADGSCTVHGTVYKNGTAIGTVRVLTGGGPEIYVESFAVFVVDDLISVYCANYTPLITATVKDFKICAQWDMETVVD